MVARLPTELTTTIPSMVVGFREIHQYLKRKRDGYKKEKRTNKEALVLNFLISNFLIRSSVGSTLADIFFDSLVRVACKADKFSFRFFYLMIFFQFFWKIISSGDVKLFFNGRGN